MGSVQAVHLSSAGLKAKVVIPDPDNRLAIESSFTVPWAEVPPTVRMCARVLFDYLNRVHQGKTVPDGIGPPPYDYEREACG